MTVLINKNSACSWTNKVCTNHQHKSHKKLTSISPSLNECWKSLPCAFSDCKTLEIGPPLSLLRSVYFTHSHTHTHTHKQFHPYRCGTCRILLERFFHHHLKLWNLFKRFFDDFFFFSSLLNVWPDFQNRFFFFFQVCSTNYFGS